jgi:3-phytase
MKKSLLLVIIALIVHLLSCSEKNDDQEDIIIRKPLMDTILTTTADKETIPVAAGTDKDAADDPAIWVHPTDPSKSRIYGTNKRMGLAVYDLDGNELFFYKTGRINNVDVAYNFPLNGKIIDLCTASNRTYKSIDLYAIDSKSGELTNILSDSVFSGVDDVYGICFYRSRKTDDYYIFINGKNGEVEQYQLIPKDYKITLIKIRTIKFDTQIEGMVADHHYGYLYVGEEVKGIWKIGAEPGDSSKILVELSGEQGNNNIKYDIEGLTIYYSNGFNGFLIASSQGNNSYAVFERKNNEYLFSFRIWSGMYDGTDETDGIDVINESLGPKFPNGLFVAQDGNNIDSGQSKPQNFKYLSWNKIADLFELSLGIHTDYSIRKVFSE